MGINTNNIHDINEYSKKSEKLNAIHEEQNRKKTPEQVNNEIDKIIDFIHPDFIDQVHNFRDQILLKLGNEDNAVVNHPTTTKVVLEEINKVKQSYIKENRMRTSVFEDVKRAA